MAGTMIRIGTRGSRLALWQASAVRDALVAAHRLAEDVVEIVPIKTSGDAIRDRPLSEAGGKGLFSKEIEAALLAGDIDLAVHSAKDMETVLPPGLRIAACLAREDVRDALITRTADSFEALPREALVGSASLRRAALLRRARPDLRLELLRGNVPTRIAKVKSGAFDATLLAAAGLKRLDLAAEITELLPLERFPPACGQGIIAVECRSDDAGMLETLAAIDDSPSAAALACERAFLAELDGSCRTPVAGYARIEEGTLVFDGLLLSEDGREECETQGAGDPEQAALVGREAGQRLKAQAPAHLLERVGIGAVSR